MTSSTPFSHRVPGAARAISSNGLPLPDTASYLTPAPDSTPLLDDPPALRGRYQRDGFVVLRGLLDRSAVVELRRQYFASFPPGYLVARSDPGDGLFSGRRPAGLPPHGVAGHPAHAFVRSAPFARFVAAPQLAAVAERLLDTPVDLLPRCILRHFDRSAPVASRAHADFRYLDGGSERVVTVWIPLGDVAPAGGGLVYQAGSHHGDPARLAALRQVNDRPGDDRPLSHDLAWVAEQLEHPWSWADFQAGDVALHSPHVVHASLDTTTDAMRASVDVRFLARGDATDPRWLLPWAGDDGN